MDEEAEGERTPRRSQRPEEQGFRGLSHRIGDSGEEPVHQPPPPHATLSLDGVHATGLLSLSGHYSPR